MEVQTMSTFIQFNKEIELVVNETNTTFMVMSRRQENMTNLKDTSQWIKNLALERCHWKLKKNYIMLS